jgi:K+-sensing histidine kinase KdpD
MRLLVEFARTEDAEKRDKQLDELDTEVVGVDGLVSELLAASRIDFGALRRTELIAYDIAKQALERVGPKDAILEDRTEGATFLGDATLVARAVGNLLENAKRHAGGAARLRILERGPRIAFEVDDDGPGFSPGEEEQVFQPFYRGKSGGENGASVGLGLALVKRIAEAHGGRAYAQNRDGSRGARVGIELARS